jgi:signal transduction histidine kinase
VQNTAQEEVERKEEKIKDLRVQIAMSSDGDLHDQVSAYQTSVAMLQKQLAKVR